MLVVLQTLLPLPLVQGSPYRSVLLPHFMLTPEVLFGFINLVSLNDRVGVGDDLGLTSDHVALQHFGYLKRRY